MATVVLVDDPKLAVIIQQVVDSIVEYKDNEIAELEEELFNLSDKYEKLDEEMTQLLEKIGK